MRFSVKKSFWFQKRGKKRSRQQNGRAFIGRNNMVVVVLRRLSASFGSKKRASTRCFPGYSESALGCAVRLSWSGRLSSRKNASCRRWRPAKRSGANSFRSRWPGRTLREFAPVPSARDRIGSSMARKFGPVERTSRTSRYCLREAIRTYPNSLE